jgi:hypothetical protein
VDQAEKLKLLSAEVIDFLCREGLQRTALE